MTGDFDILCNMSPLVQTWLQKSDYFIYLWSPYSQRYFTYVLVLWLRMLCLQSPVSRPRTGSVSERCLGDERRKRERTSSMVEESLAKKRRLRHNEDTWASAVILIHFLQEVSVKCWIKRFYAFARDLPDVYVDMMFKIFSYEYTNKVCSV